MGVFEVGGIKGGGYKGVGVLEVGSMKGGGWEV